MTPGDGITAEANDDDGLRASVARRYVVWGAAAFGAVLLALIVWMVVDVLRVRSALNDAKDQANDLAAQLKEVGPGGESAIADQLAADVVRARKITDGPMWSIGSHLPLVGGDFKVVHEATHAVSDVATEGIPALTKLATDRDNGGLGVKNGAVDLSVIRKLVPTLERANQVFTRGREQFRAIDASGAHGFVKNALGTVQEKLDQAQELVAKGADGAKLAPGMLGANGARTYLLVFQNNAEVRSTGGIPGAYAELVAKDGALTIHRQGEGSSTGYFNPPALPISREEQNLYGTLPGNFWVDANFTPDFPRTAQILRAMYAKKFHTQLDGIISVDPIALARVLKATGPIRISKDIALSSENVIPVLLNGVYTQFPNDDNAQNAFFNAVADKIFHAFIAGATDPTSLVKELQASNAEGRIIVNATRPAEQALFADATIGGALPIDTGASPNIGLYLNDSTAAKMEFYLQRSTTVKATSCKNKVQTFRVATTLTSLAPKDVMSLGVGVTGYGFARKNGHMKMVLTYFAPLGGKVTAIQYDGQQVSVNHNTLKGLFLSPLAVDLAPGQTHKIVVTIQSGPGQQKDGVFRTTPGIEVTPNNVPIASAC
jgi:hypothetical protein